MQRFLIKQNINFYIIYSTEAQKYKLFLLKLSSFDFSHQPTLSPYLLDSLERLENMRSTEAFVIGKDSTECAT